ncbi:MAG: UDP-2,3-diacylglucosamine diphosphatase [Pseudomonadales bacterium]|nr:UDP-2,3-diacylglucosamine diphosphatase [Pseudomonadales bacterium]
MMAQTDTRLLISDLHLEADRPELTQAFFKFLHTVASGAHSLYILGDFFNVWLGDDHPSPLHLSVAAALNELNRDGTAIYLMHGNRDFLLGEDFAGRCRAHLLAEPFLLQCHGRQYLLLHGDALCTGDLDYMRFRHLVRSPQWQQQFLSQPLALRQQFAEQARARSRAMSSNKAEDIMDVNPEEVVKVMAAHRVKTLIHGHTHRPGRHDLALGTTTAQRLVLGDWDQQGWYVQLNQAGEELISFSF